MKNKPEAKTYEKLIAEMRSEAKAYNKHLTDDFFDGLGFHGLLNFCHPIYRNNYLNDYRKIEREDRK